MHGSHQSDVVSSLMSAAARTGAGIMLLNGDDRAIYTNPENDKIYPFIDFTKCPTYDEMFWACIHAGNYASGELDIEPEAFLARAHRFRHEMQYAQFTRRHSTGKVFMVFHEKLDGIGSYAARIDVTDQVKGPSRSLFGPVAWTHLAAREHASPLERLEVAGTIVSHDGRILDENSKFRALIERQDGLFTIGGKISAEPLNALEKLTAAISSLAAKPASDILLKIPRTTSIHPYLICVSSELPPRWSLGRPYINAVLVTIVEPDAPPIVGASDIAMLYGLTMAEARVATSIGCGETISEIASSGSTSINTIRNQLSSVFSKTGFSRQSDLVRMVMNIGRLCRRSIKK